MSKEKNKLSFSDFNDTKPVKATSKPITEAWKNEEDEDVEEAVCVICDEVFDASPNRPPILCNICKTGLKELLRE